MLCTIPACSIQRKFRHSFETKNRYFYSHIADELGVFDRQLTMSLLHFNPAIRRAMMTDPVQHYTIELDAYSIDDEFEQIILKDHGVKIIDRSGEPWSVIFKGTRDQLSEMVLRHWADQVELTDEDFSPVKV